MHRVSSQNQLRRLRAHQQRLNAINNSSSPAETARHLCALQSQEWTSAQLAIHARTTNATQADVIHAREVDRSFVLTWTLRGTLHLVAAEDLHWQLALCGPGAIRATRRRYEQLGLTESTREEALAEIQSILSSEGAQTRSELARALASRGTPVEGQAIHHLVRFAALRGLVCLGAERSGALTYALVDDWLPAANSAAIPDDPLAVFARRFLAAYAPATAADFARWSGLSAKEVKTAWRGVADESVTVAIPSGEAQMLKTQLDQIQTEQREPTVRYLPRYDNYLLGYESRAFMVADAHAKQVHPGGGLIRASVIIDGEAMASWKLGKQRHGVRITVTPYESIDSMMMPLLETEADALGRFLNTNTVLRIEGS